MDINESDWRVFRRLHSIALERFCKRVLEEVREGAECKTDYHDCYRKVHRLIRNYDKRIAVAFDNPRRSTAFVLLANIIDEGLLSAEELKQFSQEAQAQIKLIQELRGA
jgi:hypothetical protein